MRRGLIGGGVLAALWFLCGWVPWLLQSAGGSLATLGILIPSPLQHSSGIFGSPLPWALFVQLLMAIVLVAGFAVLLSWLGRPRVTFAAGWLAAILTAFAIGAALDLGSFFAWLGPFGVRGAANTMGSTPITVWWAVTVGWIPALITRQAPASAPEASEHRGHLRTVVLLIAAIALVALPLAAQASHAAGQRQLREDHAKEQADAQALADPDGAAPRDPDAAGAPVPGAVDGTVGDGACTTSNTTIMAPGFDAATGHRGLALRLVNSAEVACTLNGYPDVAFGDQNEHLLEVAVAHGGSFMAQDPRPTEITLQPGETATAVIGWDANSVHGQLAARHLWAAVLPGDDRLTWDMSLDIIAGSTVHVTAWRAGPLNAG